VRVVANTKVRVFLGSRQIFKFGLLKKKDNKKSAAAEVAFFPPYYSYTNPLPVI